MKTAFKWIGIVAAGLVALALVAGVIVSLLFDPNDYKGFAAEWVQQRTGRQLEIQGDLTLSVFPWLAVETGSLQLSNAEGFQDVPFATVDSSAVRVRLLPLLSRRFEVGTVELDGLILNLGRDSAGRGNWQDLFEPVAETDEASTSAPSAPQLERVQIAGLRLDRGTIYWREQVNDVRYIARNLSLTTGALEPGQAVKVSLAGNVLSVEPQANVDMELGGTVTIDAELDQLATDFDLEFDLKDGRDVSRAQGTFASSLAGSLRQGNISIGPSKLTAALTEPPAGPEEMRVGASWSAATLDAKAQTLAFESLTTDVGGIAARWELEGERILAAAKLSGAVQVENASWQEALLLADVETPAGMSVEDLGTFKLRSDFTYQAEHGLSVVNTVIDTLGLRVSGSGRLNPDGKLTGAVTIPSFQADQLLKAAGGALPQDVDVSAVDRLALSTRFELDPDSGRTLLQGLSAELLGAALVGEVAVSGAAGNRSYSGTVSAARFDGRAFATAFASLLPENLTPAELGPLAIDTRFRYRAADDELRLEGLSLEALGLTATGELAARSFTAAPTWSGRLSSQTFSPRSLMRRFGQAVPETADSGALTRARVASNLELTDSGGNFRAMRLELDDSVISGEFSVDDYADPSYGFDLAIDSVDVDRYLPPKAAEGAVTDSPESQADELNVPKEALESLKLAGRVAVGRMVLAGLSFQDLTTNVRTGDSVAQLGPARVRLYGGQFEGGLDVDARDSVPSMSLRGTATDLNIEPLLMALRGEANLTGTGSFELALTGQGTTVIENVRSAAGDMRFDLRDGSLEGFNVGYVLCRVYNLQAKLPPPSSQVPKRTAFTALRGTATVREGIATSNDLDATASFLRVTGGGSVDLANQGLRYDLLATLTGSVPIAGCQTMDSLIGDSFPFTVRGSIAEPDIKPDFGKLLERAIRRRLEDEIKDRLLDRLGFPRPGESSESSSGTQPPAPQ